MGMLHELIKLDTALMKNPEARYPIKNKGGECLQVNGEALIHMASKGDISELVFVKGNLTGEVAKNLLHKYYNTDNIKIIEV